LEAQQLLGKSRLAFELAKKLDTEIVSGDSMQIYKYMDIGTAKSSKSELEEIPHHMINIVSPDERYSVSAYKRQAAEAIDSVIKKGKIPVLVGGTGLYIESLIYGIEFKSEEIDESYRESLHELAVKEGLEKLYEMAKKIDPKATSKISQNDEKRIIRILEIYHKTGKTKTEQEIESRAKEVKYDYILFGITFDREKLYERINERVDIMIEQGLIDEVRGILSKYEKLPTAMQGIRI